MPKSHYVFVSECGRYYAVLSGNVDRVLPHVLEIEGERRTWVSINSDGDRNPVPRLVGSWSNLGGKIAGYGPTFEVVFFDVSTRKKIKPLTGNTIINSYSTKFLTRKRIAAAVWSDLQERIAEAMKQRRAA